MPGDGDVRLSVLDTSPIVQGSTARQALHNTLDLARAVDQLGYHRYWVPEHHSMRGVASADPAVLAAAIAAATQRLRVGAGGVLLPNHPPLLVAERWGMLEALHPGRIDLGLGRAPGGPPHIAEAIRRSQDATTVTAYADQLDETLAYFDPPEDWTVRAVPARGNQPPVWLLGSSTASAQLAAERGLPCAIAHHLNPSGAADAAETYRSCFQPSARLAELATLVSVSVIVAADDDQAEWLAGSTRLKILSRRAGRRILLPSPEQAAVKLESADPAEVAACSGGLVVGSPDTVRKQLRKILHQTGTRELMVTTPIWEHPARKRSYELLSDAMTSAATRDRVG